MASSLPKAKVVKRQDLTKDLWLVWLEPEIPFTFKPGQYCTIGVDNLERPYSIVSAPHEKALELFIELVPRPIGQLTPLLYELQEGAEVTFRPRAKGLFTFDPKFHHQVMLATVTGVVPFVSIIRDYLHRGASGHKFYVLHGASYQDEFAYREELERLASCHPNLLTYIPTVSRPEEKRNTGWQGVTGRVNLMVEPWLQRFGVDKESTLVYACGHPGMIEDVKARLIPQGWNIKEERFWKED